MGSGKGTVNPPLYRDVDYSRPVHLTESTSEPYRSPFRRDYARLIHSAAFRRLQGKTQLFPSSESDFFRNRLTHSLEVAQIAKSIAIRLNNTEDFFKERSIDLDLVETAALAHDLGHPPFGHNGEAALDECMRDEGGFEGNAQTLRILAKLEKKQTLTVQDDKRVVVGGDGTDNRAGLNLTYRTLASVLKYNEEIPVKGKDRKSSCDIQKGYYYTESALVSDLREKLDIEAGRHCKTIECSIMDIADDIAYSTYDLEDAFKAGFLSPLAMLSAESALVEKVATKVNDKLVQFSQEFDCAASSFSAQDVRITIYKLFSEVFTNSSASTEETGSDSVSFEKSQLDGVLHAAEIVRASGTASVDGYYRTRMTSQLVERFIQGVKVRENPAKPWLSLAYLDLETLKQVEVLKHFAYRSLIMSTMLKVAEYRGKDIVASLFEALDSPSGHLLMPNDFRELHSSLKYPDAKRRAICDFIAGMTDRYAIRFYERLFSAQAESIFTPI